MKHATESTLRALDDLFADVRLLPGVKERRFGVFYRKSKAFLHFHEDGGRIFADVRLAGPDFDRFETTTRAQQKKLLAAIRRFVN